MTRLTALAIQVVCNVGLRELQVQATNLAAEGRQQVWAGMGTSVHGTPNRTWAARLAAIAGGGAVMEQDSTVGVRVPVTYELRSGTSTLRGVANMSDAGHSSWSEAPGG